MHKATYLLFVYLFLSVVRYIQLYEIITGEVFDIPTATANNAASQDMETLVLKAVNETGFF